jgi:hypothetical protein
MEKICGQPENSDAVRRLHLAWKGGVSMRRKLLAVCLAVSLLCSCSLQLNAADLLEPPRLSAEQSAIYDALETAIGTSSFKLKYPRSGSNRSACTLCDLDGDGVEEAIAFYELTTGGSTSTWISVLSRQDDTWKSLKQIPGEASEVDRLEFASILGGEKSIVVGWASTGEDNSTCIFYNFVDGQLEKFKTDFSYNEMLIADVDGDGLEEVVLCTLNGTRSATMALLHESGGRIVRTSTVEMPSRLTGYLQLTAGELASGMSAVFADVTLSDGTTDTAVAQVDRTSQRTVLTELSGEELGVYDSFNRPVAAALCEDINGDGLIDIPVATPLPGYEKSDEEDALWRITYKSVLGGELTDVRSFVINEADGYRFALPDRWGDAVTVRRTSDGGEWSFIVYNGDLNDSTSAELLRIRTVSPSDYQDKFETAEYTTIATKGIYEYQISLPDNAPEPYALSLEEATGLFALLS